MSQSPNPQSDQHKLWGSNWRVTVALVLGITALRLFYSIFLSPFTLIEDEAHYWEWSRRLDWSYYTKGPGVAWSIAAATKVFGTHEWSIRLPAILGAGVCTYAVASLARGIFRSNRAGFFAAIALLTSPVYQMLGLIMTIDSPYSACWALAMLFGAKACGVYKIPSDTHELHHQRYRNNEHWWIAVGAVIGIGCLYKYTILLALPGLVISAIVSVRGDRSGARNLLMGILGLGAMLITSLPIAIWNHKYGWPTISHLLGHLGVTGGDVRTIQGGGTGYHYNPLWTLEFVGSQTAMAGAILIIAFAYIFVFIRYYKVNRYRATLQNAYPSLAAFLETVPSGQWYLITNSLPILVFYLLVSLVTAPEGNWPLAGYITLFSLVGGLIAVMQTRSYAHARILAGKLGYIIRFFWNFARIAGITTLIAVPLLPILHNTPGIGQFIPLHRFQGADAMAAHTDALVAQLAQETGQAPFVMAMHYGRASQLAYYMHNQPVVYCASSYILDGRHTQYDYFHDTDLSHAQQLIGRPAVVVGGTQEAWQTLFTRVDLIGTLNGDGKRNRPAFKAYGYIGVHTPWAAVAR